MWKVRQRERMSCSISGVGPRSRPEAGRAAGLNFGLRGGLLGSSVSLGNARKAGPQQSGLECWGMHLGSG